MTSTVSLIVNYLSEDQKRELSLNLSQTLSEKPENLTALCDLINNLDSEITGDVYSNIQAYCFDILEKLEHHNEENFSNVLKLINHLNKLYDVVIHEILRHLNSYLAHTSPLNFLAQFNDYILPTYFDYNGIGLQSSESVSDDNSDEFIASTMNFLEYIFLNSPSDKSKEIFKLDDLVCFFIGHVEEKVTNAVSAILRWRMKSLISRNSKSKFIWDIIFTLLASGNKINLNHAYVLWLRYLSNDQSLAQNAVYQQEIIQSENYHYWIAIQAGLVSEIHEHKKFCLSILQLSVKSVNVALKNSIFSWDINQNEQYLKEWSRYTTLFEIIGIDTSLHQAQAASSDIIALISPDSIIHPSWGFALLSIGFRASMDSVRKFALNVLLSIPLQNLYLIKFCLTSLEKIFLPYMMLASHFSVRQSAHDNKDKCEHGGKITKFISSLVTNLSTDQEYDTVVYSILKVLVDAKDAFDPARIYTMLGLLHGLQNQRVLSFGKHDLLLLNLFESNCEGQLFETTSQNLNLRLLLNFQLTDLKSFIDMLTKFVKFNGYDLIIENISLILQYFSFNKITYSTIIEICEHINLSEDQKILLCGLASNMETESFDELNEIVLNESNLFACKLLETNLDTSSIYNTQDVLDKYASIFDNVLKGDQDISLYEVLGNTDISKYRYLLPSKINLVEMWASINRDVQSKEHHTIVSAIAKLKAFNVFFQSFTFAEIDNHELFNVSTVIKFKDLLLSNAHEASRSVKDFYKTKDKLYGQYFKTLLLLSYKVDFEKPELEGILKLIITSSSNYEINSSAVSLLNMIVSNKNLPNTLIPQVVDITTDIWHNLNSSRLQLNQKDLHISIINVLTHPLILKGSLGDVSVSKSLLYFSKSVIENSHGRRCLLPTLTKNLSNFQISNANCFEQLSWISEVLIRGFLLYQTKSNVFKLESLIGELYDSSVSLNPNESKIYKDIYGSEEICSRINLVAMFNSINTNEFADKILTFIIDHEDEYCLFKVLKTQDGFEEWKRIQLFSIILSIIDKVTTDTISTYHASFINLLDSEPSPLVRVYLEWIIARHLLKNESLLDDLISKLKDGVHNSTLRPSLIIAYERILYLAIQRLPASKESKYINIFLSLLIPGATSNKALTRHFSLSINCSIYPEIIAKKLSISPSIIDLLENLYKSALSSEASSQFRSGDAILWNIVGDLNLVNITGGVLLKVSDRDIDFIREDDYAENLTKAQISILNNPVGHDSKELWIKERRSHASSLGKAGKSGLLTADSQSPLQTKSGAWNTVMDVDEKSRGGDVVRSDLIVISSLVDKPPNLGGICRLCDVLGAGTLTLNDIKVKDHPQFKNVAVTADSWMPMIEVKEKEIINYMKFKKKEGYTLIGLEQTDKSVQLNGDLKFPKKSLIVLGKEKEGVPGDILAELDFCVEIKQVGVIRSMNIQTATAIIVHAYSTQHC